MPDLRVAIADIDYLPREESNTSGGILLMMQQFQEYSQRYFVTEIAVLVTDGKLNSDSEDTVAIGIEAKQKGITIVCHWCHRQRGSGRITADIFGSTATGCKFLYQPDL